MTSFKYVVGSRMFVKWLQVEAGQLKEGLISVGSRKASEDDPLDPEIIKRFDNQFQYRVIDEDYYSHCEIQDAKHFKRILR